MPGFPGALCAVARGGRALNVRKGRVVTVWMRALIKRVGGAVLICAGMAALLAAGPGNAKGSSCKPPTSAWHFASAPSLHPAHIHVCTRKHGTAAGMVFIDPFKNAMFGKSLVGQAGALMVDQGGNPVWFHRAPKGQQDSDFQTDSYGGKPVISFWEGEIAIPPKVTNLPAGAPVHGAYLFYDMGYHKIKTLKAQGKGWITDFHELIVTPHTPTHPQGTAIFFAAKKKSKNLRPYGGSANGAYEDMEIQRVDLKTNKLIFHWDIDQHIPLKASRVHAPKSGVWDPYHANSINLSKAGDTLISLRNTWGVYALKPTGATTAKFLWQVAGNKCVTKKCLLPTKAARFTWQHDVRYDGNTKISMFDDGCCNLGISGPEHAARGLILSLNFSKKRAGVVRQYHHANTREVPTAGSFRFLSNGHVFIGWGQSPYYSEHTNAGGLLYDAAMPRPDMSYRAWKAKWVGTPSSYGPAFAVRFRSGKTTAYVSWNGATKVASWRVFAGKSSSSLKSVGHAKKNGFETSIRASSRGPYFQVKAYDAQGHFLGMSGVKKISH